MNIDPIIINFVSNNYLTLTLAFALLKGLAKITPWAWDDSLTSLLFGMFKTFNPEKKEPEK